MDPLTIATAAVGALVQYAVGKAKGLAGRAVDDVVDERLDRLYETVRGALTGDDRGERMLAELEEAPEDARRQGRLEVALEGALEDDPDLAGRLEAMVEDLAAHPPAGGIVAQDTGPVAGGDVTITAGRDAAGRDLTSGGDPA